MQSIKKCIKSPDLYIVAMDYASNDFISKMDESFCFYKNSIIELYDWLPSNAFEYNDNELELLMVYLIEIFKGFDLYSLKEDRFLYNMKRSKIIDLKNGNMTFTKFNKQDKILDIVKCEELNWLDEIFNLLKTDYNSFEAWISSLAISIIHGDLNMGNIGYLEDGGLVLYDLENITYGFRIEDIAYSFYFLCIHGSSDNEVIKKKVKLFLNILSDNYPAGYEIRKMIWFFAASQFTRRIYLSFNSIVENDITIDLNPEFIALKDLVKYRNLINNLME